MQESVFDRLGMKHSSFKNPPKSGGVIPGTPLESTWSWDIGMAGNAGGGIYMSAGDMVKAGQAILQSTLLSPAQTRRWFQPRIQTGYLGAAVGAPWEMTYLESPNHRLIPYYNKDGDIGAYHSLIVLSPQHEIGAVILVAGASESNAAMVRTLMKIGLGEIILPAVEEQAKVEAKATFDGSYIDAKTNSSVVIAAGYNGTTGLTVRSLISHGVPMMGPGTSPESPLSSSLGIGNTTRLYPTTLKTVSRKEGGSGRYESRLSFRAAFQQQAIGGTLQDPCILNWANLDGVTYGKQGLDDWVFEMSEDGRAERINIRALRLNLKRKS